MLDGGCMNVVRYAGLPQLGSACVCIEGSVSRAHEAKADDSGGDDAVSV